MPEHPAIAVFSPIRTLCAICIWLSRMTPFSITVSVKAPLSIVVQAPTSTRLPIITPPS